MTAHCAFIPNVPPSDSPPVDRALAVEAARESLPRVHVTTIVARAQAGDRAALEALAKDELPRVERLMRRLLGRRADMEDLVQTVFLEMCRALPGFRGESAISTFVGGITVRVARRAMRPTAWERLRSDATEAPQSSDHPERNAVAAEQMRRVHAALERIAPKKRIAFALWAFEGMEIEAVAEVTQATVAATRSRIFYAQKELKERAAKDPYLSDLLEDRDAG